MDENRAYAALVTPRFWCARVTPIHVSGVDVPATSLQRRGCGIHALRFGRAGTGVTNVCCEWEVNWSWMLICLGALNRVPRGVESGASGRWIECSSLAGSLGLA